MKFFLLTDLSLLFSSYKSFLVIKTKKNITIIFLILSSNLLAQVDNDNVIVLKGKILKLEKSGNILSQEYVKNLNDLGELYFNQEKYAEAEKLYLKSLEINKNTLGEKHQEYANSLNNLAVLYYSQEKYNEAEPLFLKSLDVTKDILGEKSADYVNLLMNLALFYQNQGKYKDAEPFYLKSIEIDKETIGEKHPDYAIALNNLALLFREQGKFVEAEPLFINALEIRKEILGVKHPDYLTSLNNLARLYIDLGNYKEAETLFLKVLEIRKEISGEKDEDFLNTLNDLAVLYDVEAKYELAETLFLKTIEICKEIYGVKHSNYASALNSLALLYESQGKSSKAEPLMLESLKIRKENSGEKSVDYSISLSSLGGLYFKQGKYDKTEPLYLKSLEINKEILGEKHPYYAASLNNLALFYSEQGKYDNAIPLYVNSLEIKKENLGEEHPDYATSLNNLSILYLRQGKYTEAETLCLNALKIKKAILGENHPDYASSLNSLAFVYENQGKYIEAELLFLNVIEIIKKSLGENHPHYISSLSNLAELYRIMGLNEKALIYFEKFIKANKKKVIDDIPTLTEKDLIAYINFKKEQLFSTLSFLYDLPNQYLDLNVNNFENELLLNNLSLRNQDRIKISILKSGSKLLQDKYLQFIKNKTEINKIRELPLEQQPSNYGILISETEMIEKDLAVESIIFGNYKKGTSISFNNIKSKLKKNEVVLDLVSFNYYPKNASDSIVYAAFIVKKDSKFPKFISLFEEKELEFLLSKNKTKQDSTRIDKQYSEKAISDLFLKPLEKELEGISTIYLSPSGLGHQINFAALLVNNNQTLGNKYKLHILSSPAELIDYNSAKFEKGNNLELLLYGGIDYDKVNSIPNTNIAKTENNGSQTELQTRSGITGFGYLKGSKKEVDQISIKGTQSGFKTTLLNDRVATEESIKQLDGRTTPFILHLATHGFFFPDPVKEAPKNIFELEGKSKIYKASDDPMMRSGLLFSGANKYWGKNIENTTTEDGILTASEISNLDLSACQLVVLSACETGLGEVKGSEGVFGLQRAFKMAGVKNIIMSLWKVPDAQTAELFDIFYSECFAGKTIHEAFQTAQTKMKEKYSPYYWAGFVLLE
jgi:tetratricopeptide (TPR) repeat protein